MIQEGAKLVPTYTDILEELNLTSVSHQIPVNQQIALPLEQEDQGAEPLRAEPPEAEAALLHHLNDDSIHIDDISLLFYKI